MCAGQLPAALLAGSSACASPEAQAGQQEAMTTAHPALPPHIGKVRGTTGSCMGAQPRPRPRPPAPAPTSSCASGRLPRQSALLRGVWQPSTPRQEMLAGAPSSSRRRAMDSTTGASRGQHTAACSGKSSAPPKGVCTGLRAGYADAVGVMKASTEHGRAWGKAGVACTSAGAFYAAGRGGAPHLLQTSFASR